MTFGQQGSASGRRSRIVEGVATAIIVAVVLGVAGAVLHRVSGNDDDPQVAGPSSSPSAIVSTSVPTDSTGTATAEVSPSPVDLPTATTDYPPADTPTPTPSQIPESYSGVTLAPLCHLTSCTGSQQVGNQVFVYSDAAPAGVYPHFRENLAFFDGEPTSCKVLHVQFSGDEWVQGGRRPTAIDYLRFVQESGVKYAQISPGKVGATDVKLDGGPLYINASVSNDPGAHYGDVLLKIVGQSCSTPDGVAP